jgi:hypothetical protein
LRFSPSYGSCWPRWFRRQIAFVKFIGTYAEHDRIGALVVSQIVME